MTYVPCVAVISHHFQKRRALAMTIVASGSSLGHSCSTLHLVLLTPPIFRSGYSPNHAQPHASQSARLQQCCPCECRPHRRTADDFLFTDAHTTPAVETALESFSISLEIRTRQAIYGWDIRVGFFFCCQTLSTHTLKGWDIHDRILLPSLLPPARCH